MMMFDVAQLELEEEDSSNCVTQHLEKREKNRLAAQKCRNKKRDKTESLQKVSRLFLTPQRICSIVDRCACLSA